MNRNLERGSATRERLLTIAEELFVEHGFDGTSTETILREAGVSRGSLYHHFRNKDALFWGVLERVDDHPRAHQAGDDLPDGIGPAAPRSGRHVRHLLLGAIKRGGPGPGPRPDG